MVRSVTAACAECRRRLTMKTGNQMMAPLSKSRLQSSLRAFERVGVDYGGPFLTRQGRGRTRAKRYLSFHLPYNPSCAFGNVLRIRH